MKQVRRADRVDDDLRALPGEPTRRARMVEVDVRQQNVSHITGRETLFRQTRFQRGKSRAWSTFDEHDSARVSNQIGGNRLSLALKI